MHTSATNSQRPNLAVVLILIVGPLVLYLSQIGRWGIDRDEVYTLIDSSLPIAELLEWETKPIYYLICHFLLSLGLDLPTEVVLRLPSAMASGLIPVTAYVSLRAGGKREKAALLTAILFLVNPWIFGFAVTARFYGLVMLLVLAATAAMLHWYETRPHHRAVPVAAITTPPQSSIGWQSANLWTLQTLKRIAHAASEHRWLVVFFLLALIATATHTTVVTLFPAGILALVVASLVDHRQATIAFLKRWLPVLSLIAVVLIAVAWWVQAKQLAFWMSSEKGQYGAYSMAELLLALLIGLGIPVWVLAALPLVKPIRSWSTQELLLSVTAVVGIVPLLFLVQIGGGVAPYYLLGGVPAVFVLAGRHWAFIDDRFAAWGYRLAIALGILSFNTPYIMSTLSNGGHYDYRQAASFVDSITSEDTILVSSGHLNLGLFLPTDREILELGTFEGGVPRDVLHELIEKAEHEECTLIVVSRETRHRLSEEDQNWLYTRFALLRDFETPRYDHRRHRVAVYEYRPSRAAACRKTAEQLATNSSLDKADAGRPATTP